MSGLSTSPFWFQDDILMGTLSVRENLLFSANLRLNPKDHSTADKHQQVNIIIEDLGLTDCADTKVQSTMHKLLFLNCRGNIKKCYSILCKITYH